jgi:hypothetical protein
MKSGRVGLSFWFFWIFISSTGLIILASDLSILTDTNSFEASGS